MVDFLDVVGFGADVVVSYGLEHALKGSSGSVAKQLFVGAGAGAAGGLVGDAIANGGFSLTDSPEAMFYGALGGAAGAAGERFITFRLGKGKTAADDALKEADSAKSTAVSERGALENAENAHTSARTDLDEADAALRKANDDVNAAQAKVDDLVAQGHGSDSPLLTDALQQLREARDRARLAGEVREKAQKDLDQATEKFDELSGKRSELDEAKRKAEEAYDKAEAAAKAAGEKVKKFGDYGGGTLVGLGSATFMMLNEHGLPFGSDESGGDPPGAAVSDVTWVWDGYTPAAAGGVMGTAPFEQGSSPQEGAGFLLRPQKLNPTIADFYGGSVNPSNSFAGSVVDTYKMFGDLKKKEALKVTPIPVMPKSVQGVSGSAGGSSYTTVSGNLDKSAKTLTDTQQNVLSAIETVEEVSRAGKENVGRLIVGINRYLVGHLKGKSDIDFITAVGQGFKELADEIAAATAKNNQAASGINAPSAAADRAAAQDLANSVGSYAGELSNPALNPNSSQIGLNNPWNPGNLGTGPGSTPSTADLKDTADRFRERAEDLTGAANTPADVSPAVYNPGATSPLGSADAMGAMGGAGGLMDMMLPLQLMAQQKAMQDADNNMSGRMDDLDPSRFDQPTVATMPQTQPPVGTTPWSNQAAANNAAATPAAQPAQPAHHSAGTPPGATSAQPTTAVPKRVPGDDGLVPYPIPGRPTQRVPLAVAQALDNAFANKNGTDAQAAYQGTAGAWTDSKDIGDGVHPPKTGDVATFIIRQPQKAELVPARADTGPQIQPAAVVTVGGDTGEKDQPPQNEPDTGSSGDSKYRTVLLVAFGDGESGTLEAVVNGELRQFEAEMSDTEGDFGEFAGFKHPRGVEAAGDNGQDSETMATSGDQTTADIPALTMPV